MSRKDGTLNTFSPSDHIKNTLYPIPAEAYALLDKAQDVYKTALDNTISLTRSKIKVDRHSMADAARCRFLNRQLHTMIFIPGMPLEAIEREVSARCR